VSELRRCTQFTTTLTEQLCSSLVEPPACNIEWGVRLTLTLHLEKLEVLLYTRWRPMRREVKHAHTLLAWLLGSHRGVFTLCAFQYSKVLHLCFLSAPQCHLRVNTLRHTSTHSLTKYSTLSLSQNTHEHTPCLFHTHTHSLSLSFSLSLSLHTYLYGHLLKEKLADAEGVGRAYLNTRASNAVFETGCVGSECRSGVKWSPAPLIARQRTLIAHKRFH
jgi:hypothetical protein